jgi:hypothetical protein
MQAAVVLAAGADYSCKQEFTLLMQSVHKEPPVKVNRKISVVVVLQMC